MPSKAVDEKSSTSVIKATPRQRLIKALEVEADLDGRDNASFVAQILDDMIEADSLESLIEVQNAGSASGKSLVNVELEVRSFAVAKGSDKYKSPLGHFFMVDALRLDNLQDCNFTTGAPNVMLFLWKARETNRLPVQCVIRSRETDNGELLTVELLKPRPIEYPGTLVSDEPQY